MTRFFRFIPTVFFLLTAGHLSATTMIKKPNFTGFQAGVLAGGSITRTELVDPSDAPMTPNGVIAPTGFAAGLHLGYGATVGGIFLGIDAGVLKDWSSDNCQFTGIYPGNTKSFDVDFKIKKKAPAFYIAPKFGFQVDNALPYIRLGYSRTQYSMKFTVNDKVSYSEDFKVSDKRNGFLGGAGVDFLVTPCLVAGIGYDISLFGKRKTLTYTDKFQGENKLSVKHKSHQFLLKVAYKSNW